ncbi:MAG: hypothetical protein K2W96_16860 [Gemmataceae bacterium]|nr:hypothetical protein [Gemmataceae bacterium]
MSCPSTEPIDRPLTGHEAALVRWMLEQAGPEAAPFLAQLSAARVVGRCSCGCASLDFAIDGVRPPTEGGMRVLVDGSFGEMGGLFAFGIAGVLAGLEVYTFADESPPASLPEIGVIRLSPQSA